MNETPPPSPRPAWILWLVGWPGIAGAFAWGLAEGSFFFLVPDIIITLAALCAFRKSLFHLGAVVLGSMLAGSLLYAWASRDPAAASAAIHHVPFVREGMFPAVQEGFSRHGVWELCRGPSSGIPYKVYAVLAPAFTGYLPFLLATIPARLERLVSTWLLFSLLGLAWRRQFERHPGRMLALHAAFWIPLYAWYWSSI